MTPEPSPWIPVEERLPDEGVLVIALYEQCENYIAKTVRLCLSPHVKGGYYWTDGDHHLFDPDFWTPMPAILPDLAEALEAGS